MMACDKSTVHQYVEHERWHVDQTFTNEECTGETNNSGDALKRTIDICTQYRLGSGCNMRPSVPPYRYSMRLNNPVGPKSATKIVTSITTHSPDKNLSEREKMLKSKYCLSSLALSSSSSRGGEWESIVGMALQCQWVQIHCQAFPMPHPPTWQTTYPFLKEENTLQIRCANYTRLGCVVTML